MNRRKPFNRFQFNQQLFFDNNVSTKPFIDLNTVEIYCNRNLLFNQQSMAAYKFNDNSMISRFQ